MGIQTAWNVLLVVLSDAIHFAKFVATQLQKSEKYESCPFRMTVYLSQPTMCRQTLDCRNRTSASFSNKQVKCFNRDVHVIGNKVSSCQPSCKFSRLTVSSLQIAVWKLQIAMGKKVLLKKKFLSIFCSISSCLNEAAELTCGL